MHHDNSSSLALDGERKVDASRLTLILSLFAVLLLATFASAQCGPNCLFYGGDFEPSNNDANGAPNENDMVVNGTDYGAATFQNFIVPTGHTWSVTGLFTNNLSDEHPTSAYFEIRTGVSEGDAGSPIVSGFGSAAAGTFTWTPTGRNFLHHYDEFTAQVTGLNSSLPAGMYWEAVVPQETGDFARSANSNTFTRPNGVGAQVSDQQYFDSPFFGANFTNADNLGAFPTFSSGIEGVDVPEPSSLVLLGSGIAGLCGLVRRRSIL